MWLSNCVPRSTNYGYSEIFSWQMDWSEGSRGGFTHTSGSWVDMVVRLGSVGTVDQRTKSPLNKVEVKWLFMT